MFTRVMQVTDVGDVWGVGYYGAIFHHGPGNGGWDHLIGQNFYMTNYDLFGVRGASAAAVWAVGENGIILRKRR